VKSQLGPAIEALRRDIGTVGPDDRAGVAVRPKTVKEIRISQRLENTVEVEKMREINIGGQSILKTHVDDVGVDGRCFNQLGDRTHQAMVELRSKRLNRLQGQVAAGPLPVVSEFALMLLRPLEDQPKCAERHSSREKFETVDVE